MPTCVPPTAAIVGTFLVGTAEVGELRQDPITGIAITGVATTGLWVSYVCQPGLALGTDVPEFAGQRWLEPAICTTLELQPAECR